MDLTLCYHNFVVDDREIPDTVGTMVNANSPLALQHVVGLRLGSPVDLSSSLPLADLDRALCDNSVLLSLIRKRKSYWSEINPILQKWQSINDTKCPECTRVIPNNITRHLQLKHTTCQTERVRRKGSSGGDTPFQRGPWLLLLRMFAPIRIGMVWPSFVLRPERKFRPSFMDGHHTRTEIRTGTT